MTQHWTRGGKTITTGSIDSARFRLRRGATSKRQMNKENAALREALTAYADQNNWQKRSCRSSGEFVWYGGGKDGFTFARTALGIQ